MQTYNLIISNVCVCNYDFFTVIEQILFSIELVFKKVLRTSEFKSLKISYAI